MATKAPSESGDSDCSADDIYSSIYSSTPSSQGSAEDVRRGPNANESCEWGNDSLTPIACMKGSMKDLKGCPVSGWNDKRAHVVYGAFNVKRFKVDEEHILYPLGGPKLEELLQLSDKPEDDVDEADVSQTARASWIQFKPKMNRILSVLRGDAYLLLDGLTDKTAFRTAEKSLHKRIELLELYPPNPALGMRLEESFFHQRILALLRKIKRHHSTDKPLRECVFEAYFSSLVNMFKALSGVGIQAEKSTVHDEYEIAMPSFGKIPQPDFFITHSNFAIVAVVEVKCSSKRRYKSCKDCQKSKLTSQDYSNDKELEKTLTELDLNSEVEECEDSEEAGVSKDEELDDTFDQQECQIEELQKNTLPKHIDHLDFIEKKQMRCFLPQLFGKMLACTVIKDECVHRLQEPYLTQVMGIGVIGLEVQFVMMVLKDVDRKIYDPTAADVETAKSVRPYLHFTRKLNLFKQSHLAIFFRILFALGSLTQNKSIL